jgi:Tfp pilus assembly protein PilV
MKNRLEHTGFSLTETLLAVGTLAIGLLFIAGAFLAGIHFTTIATERTIAAVAADEAFAKIRLYGINPADPNLMADQLIRLESIRAIDPNEFAYPSIEGNVFQKQYYWSALCRLAAPSSRLVQLTVFVTRAAASATAYQGGAGRPIPMPVSFTRTTFGSNVLRISPPYTTWVNDGSTIVDNRTGRIYRVLQRRADQPDIIDLASPWEGTEGTPLGLVWVVPPPTSGGRDPCIAVYQKVIRF